MSAAPYAFIDCSVRSSCHKNAILVAHDAKGTEVTCISCMQQVDRKTGKLLTSKRQAPKKQRASPRWLAAMRYEPGAGDESPP